MNRGLKLLLVLDILVEIRHAKFEPCKTSNLDIAQLFVAITAHCGQINHHKSFYKKVEAKIEKEININMKKNQY